MTITELVTQLERLREKHGDLRVVVQSVSHAMPPEPEVRGDAVLLNP